MLDLGLQSLERAGVGLLARVLDLDLQSLERAGAGPVVGMDAAVVVVEQAAVARGVCS